MTATWPIPRGFLLDGYSATYEAAVSSFKADAGRPIKRSISTRAYEMIQGSVLLKGTEYSDFWTFWRITLNKGVDPFMFPHPVLNTLVKVEFAGDDPPQVTTNQQLWQASFTLRVLTET